MNDDDGGSCASGVSVDGKDDVVNLDDLVKDIKSNKKRGMLGWFKLRVIFSSFILLLLTLFCLLEKGSEYEFIHLSEYILRFYQLLFCGFKIPIGLFSQAQNLLCPKILETFNIEYLGLSKH